MGIGALVMVVKAYSVSHYGGIGAAVGAGTCCDEGDLKVMVLVGETVWWSF